MTNLTPSLEDYLETIYLLQQGTSEARVRDIATARDVKASSVSPALKRLADMGYLSYIQRESIRLTETGKIAARRIYARHVLLFQFFHDILGMPADKAREEACGLEHALSDEGMDRFVQFFESRSLVPDANADSCPKQSCACTCCPIHKTIPHTTLPCTGASSSTGRFGKGYQCRPTVIFRLTWLTTNRRRFASLPTETKRGPTTCSPSTLQHAIAACLRYGKRSRKG